MNTYRKIAVIGNRIDTSLAKCNQIIEELERREKNVVTKEKPGLTAPTEQAQAYNSNESNIGKKQ